MLFFNEKKIIPFHGVNHSFIYGYVKNYVLRINIIYAFALSINELAMSIVKY